MTAGGSVMRDLFEDDHGGWLQDVQLLDKLVAERLQSEAAQLEADGWKWAAAAVDFPWGYRDGMRVITGTAAELTQEEQARVEALQAEAAGIENDYEGVSEIPDEVEQRLTAIDQELALLLERSPVFAPEDMAMAGVFISIDVDGSLHVERGFVRAEDEPKPDSDMPDDGGYAGGEDGHDAGSVDADRPFGGEPSQGSEPSGEPEEDESSIKPLPDKLVCELTAERTLALQDAVANRPEPDSDPLPGRLKACGGMGELALSSPDCRAAWAEKRRRFLGIEGGEPSPAPQAEPPHLHQPSVQDQ